MNNFIYDIPVKVYFGKDQLGNLREELMCGVLPGFRPLNEQDIINIFKMCL